MERKKKVTIAVSIVIMILACAIFSMSILSNKKTNSEYVTRSRNSKSK